MSPSDEKLAGLPSFCRPVLDVDNPSLMKWIDFWAVEASGDNDIDRARGESYADEAITYARCIGQPGFVDCVVVSVALLLLNASSLNPLPNGFIDRIIEAEPDCVARIRALPAAPEVSRCIERIFALYPRLRN